MGQADELGLFGQVCCKGIAAQQSVVGDRQVFHHDAAPLGLQLPGHDVGVVLHVGDDDFVACLHLAFAERRRHEVDGLGGAASEDDLLRLAGVDELAYLFTCCLVQVGSLLGEIVDAAVHIGIDVQVLVAHGVEHTQRLLCRSRIVQIDQWLLIYFAAQYREVFPYLINIIHP